MRRAFTITVGVGLVVSLAACSAPTSSVVGTELSGVGIVTVGGQILDSKASDEFRENSTPIDPETVEFSENVALDEAEIEERAEDLAREYSVGEPLSLADLEFVRAYLIPASSDGAVTSDQPSIVTASNRTGASDIELALVNGQTWTFSQTQRTAAGVTAATQGSASINIGFVDHTWSAGWTAKRISGASLTKMVSTLRVQLYGAVAAPPYVGLITNWSRTETKTGVQSTYFSRNGSAVGAVAYYNMSGNTVFYTSQGSFQIGN